MVDVWIPLTRGMMTVIDVEDYPLVSKYKWRVIGTKAKKFYAEAGRNRDRILMHRLILGITDRLEVDHKDGDGLNNRRKNIRPSTRSQNNMNRKSWTGRYKGVVAIAPQFQAFIRKDHRKIYLGLYKTAEEAAMAYDVAAREYHGEFASLNFPSGEAPSLLLGWQTALQ